MRGRGNAAIGEITATARAGPRRQIRLEEFCREFDNVVERLAALFLRLRLARHHRQRNAGNPGQPFDGFGKTHAFGLHHEVENVAVLL